jgi:hypothetical protein
VKGAGAHVLIRRARRLEHCLGKARCGQCNDFRGYSRKGQYWVWDTAPLGTLRRNGTMERRYQPLGIEMGRIV